MSKEEVDISTRVDSESNHQFALKTYRYEGKQAMFQQKTLLVSVGGFSYYARAEHAVPNVARPHM
jgi:hypothetical protein